MNRYNNLNLDAINEVFNIVLEEFAETYKTIRNNRDLILQEIAQILLDYQILNDFISLSSKEKYILLNKLFKLIEDLIGNEYKTEKFSIKMNLEKTIEETNNLKYYVMSLGIEDVKFKRIKKNTIQDIVNRKIDKKNWSDRLWNNKFELERKLKKDIKGFLEGKISVNKIKKVIGDRFSQNAYNSKRLIETEITRCQSEVNEQFFKEENIEKVMYLATLDHKTCDDCQKHDGKTYNLNEVRPKVPLHPTCRCCYVEILKDWKPKTRKDNTKLNDTINFIDYKNWLKKTTS